MKELVFYETRDKLLWWQRKATILGEMLSSAKQPIDDRRQQPSGIRTILYSLC